MPKGRRRTKNTCAECGAVLGLDDDTITVSGEKYCKICGPPRQKECEANKLLNDFLYILCDKDADSMPTLATQVKQMKDKNGWKTESILAVLEYLFGEDGILKYNREYGIKSIVERYYPIVRDYYIGKKELQDKFPDEEILDILQKPPRVITIKRSQLLKNEEEFNEKRKNLIYGPPISLDTIPDEDNFDDEDY